MKTLLFIHLLLGSIQSPYEYFSVYFVPGKMSSDSIVLLSGERVTPKMIDDLSSKARNQETGVIIQNLPSGLYATQSCQMELFKWIDNQWVNQYAYNYSGHNCGSYFFEYDSMIFNYGGYGYWERHSKMTRFDTKNNGWELVINKGIPDDYTSYFTSTVGDTLFCIQGIYINQATKKFEVLEDGGFYLNLKTNQWERYYWKMYSDGVFRESGMDPVYQLEDYSVYPGTDRGTKGFLVFEKATKKIYYLDIRHTELFRTPFFSTFKNSIVLMDPRRGLFNIDLDQVKPDLRLLAEVSYNSPLQINGDNVKLMSALVLVLSMVLIIIYQRKQIRKVETKATNGTNKYKELDHLITKLKSHAGQNLETDELDIILEISKSLSPEGIRGRRSKLISEINNRHNMTQGIDLILRMRSNTDKRFYSYKIDS